MREGGRVQEAEAVAELQGAGAERNEVEGHMAEVAEWPKQGGVVSMVAAASQSGDQLINMLA